MHCQQPAGDLGTPQREGLQAQQGGARDGQAWITVRVEVDGVITLNERDLRARGAPDGQLVGQPHFGGWPSSEDAALVG